MRQLISSGSPFEAEIGYSRAVVDGDWVFVSATTGFDYATMATSEDVTKQTEQALRNIGHALAEASSAFSDVSDFERAGPSCVTTSETCDQQR
jgi:enamine deaminase RidA (YjgF/YER057c/UK114 family)